jgi:pectin methylesterase-like acyl-CoA thioesterase
MYMRYRKVISRVLVLAMLTITLFGTSSANIQAEGTADGKSIDVWDFGGVQQAGSSYTNHITIEMLNGLKAAGDTTSGTFARNTSFGDVTIATGGGHFRLYYRDGSVNGTSSYGSPTTKTFSDGYTNNGSIYFSGNNSPTSHHIRVDQVEAGDIITLYGFYTNSSGSGTPVYNFDLTNESGTTTTVTSEAITTAADIFTYRALDSGTLKIYVTGIGSGYKPHIARITRTPGVNVSGTLDLNGHALTGHSLVFQNQTTSEIIPATLNSNGTFETTLTAGYPFIAVLQGVSSEYSISDATKSVTTALSDITNGLSNIGLVVDRTAMATVSGAITGFDGSYSLEQFKIMLNPPADSLAPSVEATIDKSAKTYTADVRAGIAYTVSLLGVNDYSLTGGGNVHITSNTTQDITVTPKAIYNTTGTFVGLPSTATITSIQFTHEEDGYVYPGTITDAGTNGGYSANLRDGAYAVSAVSSDPLYKTIGHVVVNGSNTTKDIKFSSTAAPSPLPWVGDLYVGDSSKENNFATVKEALAAAARMNPKSEAERITIHIAPGIYRAQLMIATPYISLVNTDPTQEVKITWYYGVGYDYYSVGPDGKYNEDRAFDKYLKDKAGKFKWGATVFLTSAAKGFRAENITFENSFNKYMTQEELDDGVEVTKTEPSNLTVRTADLDVTSRAATERAAAMGIEADNVEFYNSKFISNQDTLYTGNSDINLYFKNSYIEGNTDYIFGDGNAVFDNSILNFTGYSEEASGGYITAAKPSNPNYAGYLFRNSTITWTESKKQAPGYFGRPWGQEAKVKFLDTKLEDSSMIAPQGWTSMSGSTPDKAGFYEYNTQYNGVPVDTSSRTGKVLTPETAITNVRDYFGSDWTPYYYEPSSVTAPVLRVDSAGQTGVVLGWQSSTSTIGSIIYAIYQDGQKVGTTADTSYSVQGLTPGTSYSFRVEALNTAGDTAASAEVQASTVLLGAPSAPVIAAAPGNGAATITWNTVTDATYYTVKSYSVTDSVYQVIFTSDSPTVTSYTYSGLTNGTTYYFVVTASNSHGESDPSNIAEVTPAAEGTAPVAPSVSATAGGTTATLSWNAVPGATAYTIKGGKASGDYPTVVQLDNGNTTSHTFTGLTYGTTYYYVVTASNEFGESLQSNEIAVTAGQQATIKPEDFVGYDIGSPAITGSSSFDDDSNVFTLTGAGTGINKNATGLDQLYMSAVKIKGDYTISAKASFEDYAPGKYGMMGLTVRESLDANSFHYTHMEQYASTAVGGRKMYRYTGKANGSNLPNMPLNGSAYLQLTKTGDKITSIISTTPIPANPENSPTLAITSETAVGLDVAGNPKELYVGFMVTSANATKTATAKFEDIKIVMADGTVAFDSNEGKPVAPKNVVTKPYDKSATISWDALATATSYTIKQSSSEQGPFVVAQTVNGSANQALISGLDNDKTYYFVVTASNASGESVPSAVIHVTPSAETVLPPVITMTSAAPASEVFSAVLPLSGSVNKESTLTIKHNGSLVSLDGANTSLSLGKNGSFSKSLVLVTGANEIVITAVDTYGNTTTQTYSVTYTYKAANIAFSNAEGQAVTTLTAGQEIVVQAGVENFIASTQDAMMVVGLYDDRNQLIKFITTSETLLSGESDVFYAKLKLPDDVSGYSLKVFIWDSAATMRPISDVIVLKQS